ncbi:hypothetical protein K440DRAFT_630692 [Wilcoxina mikolae CBS 423.85]|nr:hypothetical protein K440DRAFT_630692 [Wilcoxina mikolae CBS 423.85]
MSMKAASRARDTRGFSHTPGSRLTIDPDHHVTEAIGDMYGDFTDETGNRYSYIQSAPGETSRSTKRHSTLSVPKRGSTGGGGFGGVPGVQTPPASPARSGSPSLSDTANKQYPLNDIDYESDPVAVAQEISNLQALRRMSMDVTSTADPDLPSFNSFVPSTPPDDSDPGSVFWVPARLHPELAPQEFSAYLEQKKNEIRRPQTREGGKLSPNGPSSTGPSLRRKKSMLSRQIDAEGGRHYRDGAERLEKRKSLTGGDVSPVIQLDDLMKDPTALMHKLSVDSQRRIEEGDRTDDVPIIFAPKVGLKRSTATHYRRGSLRRGERVGSKRILPSQTADADGEDYTPSRGFRLDRVATEPILPSSTEDRDELGPMPSTSFDELISKATPDSNSIPDKHKSAPAPKARRSSSPKATTRTRTSEPPPPVPIIVETPPPVVEHPERRASLEPPPSGSLKKRPPMNRSSDSSPDVSTEHMVVPEPKGDKKDRKRPDSSGSASKDRKTSWGWLLGDSEKAKEKEEQKEREKVKAKKEKRPKSADKNDKNDKNDGARLDVLQKSIELGNTGKVIGSDPAAATINEPAKSETRESRRSRGEEKKDKEKDSGFLSFFGGSRKKTGDSSSTEKKVGRSSSRGTSPDPHHEKPTPYYYTRFPIHIERAIYRLSHLKLANPRRPLHQQVLLSNFMYSYLAKVQQTQPHLIQQATVSQSQQQKQAAAEQQRQQEEQRWQQRQEEQQRQRGGGGYDDANTEYVDDDYDDDTRPRSRQAQYEAGQHDGNGEQGYYDQQGGGRDERDDMW